MLGTLHHIILFNLRSTLPVTHIFNIRKPNLTWLITVKLVTVELGLAPFGLTPSLGRESLEVPDKFSFKRILRMDCR